MQVEANLWRETLDFLFSRRSVCIKVTYIHCVFCKHGGIVTFYITTPHARLFYKKTLWVFDKRKESNCQDRA